MELVFMNNDRPITTSRLIAEKFTKNHRDILRAIRELECPLDFTERNFALSEYKDSTGRKLPEYHITKDGFTFLVMGFTGKQASKFKVEYINAFNQMEKQLKEPKELSRLEVIQLALESEKQRLQLENRVKTLEPKARLYDKVMDDGRLYSMSEVAKVLKNKGVGRNKLYQKLREWGLLFSNKNEPKQEYVNRGYFEVKYTWVDSLEMKIPSVKVTNKGLKYIENKLNSDIGFLQ